MFSHDKIQSLNELELSLYSYIIKNSEKVIYMRISFGGPNWNYTHRENEGLLSTQYKHGQLVVNTIENILRNCSIYVLMNQNPISISSVCWHYDLQSVTHYFKWEYLKHLSFLVHDNFSSFCSVRAKTLYDLFIVFSIILFTIKLGLWETKQVGRIGKKNNIGWRSDQTLA